MYVSCEKESLSVLFCYEFLKVKVRYKVMQNTITNFSVDFN